MTKAEEILEKHLANNIDQRTYLKCSKLTYDICIDAINEAINYTRSCETFYCSECGHNKKAVNTTLEKLCCARCRSFLAN